MWEFISPTSHAFCTISCGKVESLSRSQATRRISFSAKSWARSRMSFCSSVRLKSTTLLAAPWPRAVLGRPIDSSVNPLARRLQQPCARGRARPGPERWRRARGAGLGPGRRDSVVREGPGWARPGPSGGVGELSMERERRPRSVRGPGSEAEAREEIRQMLEAKSARREARGDPPLDVEAEIAAQLRSLGG